MAGADDLEPRVAALGKRVHDLSDLRTRMKNGFAEMRGRLDHAAAGQARIAELPQGLIEPGGS
jgi:hypothetical protein